MADLDLLNGQKPAILALANGSFFSGYSIGAEGTAVGEVIFNTSMTGYQEILTDPSYAGQILTLTYPHIGNVGINLNDQESNRIWAAGLIIRELSPIVSNWRAQQSLGDYLKREGIVAIAGVDTRRLTRIIRQEGTLSACILVGENPSLDEALKRAQSHLDLKNLTQTVSTTEPHNWVHGSVSFFSSEKTVLQDSPSVVVYDFGVKHQILRLLVDNNCSVTVVPPETDAETVIALDPDGIVLSNGPGDPKACQSAIIAIQQFLERGIPILGICLGFQLLALACGGKTRKMKFGHHGANHPVQRMTDGRVFITSQNHSFCVDENSLPETLQVTHRSLFDGTLQGIRHRIKPAMAFQGHPEAGPGPHDIREIFEDFTQLLKQKCHAKQI